MEQRNVLIKLAKTQDVDTHTHTHAHAHAHAHAHTHTHKPNTPVKKKCRECHNTSSHTGKEEPGW